MDTPTYLFTAEFLVDNDYDSFINNNVQTKVFTERPRMQWRYSNENLQHYTKNLLSSCLRKDVLAICLQTSCISNIPQLMS